MFKERVTFKRNPKAITHYVNILLIFALTLVMSEEQE